MEKETIYRCPSCKGHISSSNGNCPRCGSSMKYMGKHTQEDIMRRVQQEQLSRKSH